MEKTTPTLPAEQEVKQTRVTTVSVRVKQELDTGYLPFLRYMQKTNWKNPPFGMRDATRATRSPCGSISAKPFPRSKSWSAIVSIS